MRAAHRYASGAQMSCRVGHGHVGARVTRGHMVVHHVGVQVARGQMFVWRRGRWARVDTVLECLLPDYHHEVPSLLPRGGGAETSHVVCLGRGHGGRLSLAGHRGYAIQIRS